VGKPLGPLDSVFRQDSARFGKIGRLGRLQKEALSFQEVVIVEHKFQESQRDSYENHREVYLDLKDSGDSNTTTCSDTPAHAMSHRMR